MSASSQLRFAPLAAALALLCVATAATASPIEPDPAVAPAPATTAAAATAPATPETSALDLDEALAQNTPPASTPAASAPVPAPPPPEPPAPTSTEQGQTPLDESFAGSHDDWVRETRRQAWEDTHWDVQIRSFYLNRNKYDDTDSEAWALGGSVGFKTGYFRERFAFGATLYTSQPLHNPDDKGGTLLLEADGDGYTALGELYGEFRFNDATRLSLGRRAIDTPYINRNDNRMSPNTFELLTVQSLHGGTDGRPEWRWGGGYFHSIKERNSDDFVSMAQDAGAPDGVDRGVYAIGGNYKAGNFSIGAIDYYSDDIINIFYTEAKFTVPLNDAMKLMFALQYSDETSVGDELLKGTDFSSDQWGGKAELAWGGLLLTAAYTSAGGDANMQNPWSGYPGYTSVQVEDFNRDGEDAMMYRAGYTFQTIPGLSAYALFVDGSDPDSPTEYAKDELDFNLQWAPPEGLLKGLMVRLRYADVSQDDPAHTDLEDVRIMVYYDPPSL